MKLTSEEARKILEKARAEVEEKRWIDHSISVRANSRENSKSIE